MAKKHWALGLAVAVGAGGLGLALRRSPAPPAAPASVPAPKTRAAGTERMVALLLEHAENPGLTNSYSNAFRVAYLKRTGPPSDPEQRQLYDSSLAPNA